MGIRERLIVLPRTVEELQIVSDLYRIVGLPGCAGSADCVHIFWDNCPANLQSRCKGKEKFPSVVFQVVASHTKKILSVSGVQYGTANDKTISRSDSALWRIRKEGDILKESTFQYYKEDGSVAEEKDGYFYIVDGGYNIWMELIAPLFKHEPDSSIALSGANRLSQFTRMSSVCLGYLRDDSRS